MSSPDVNQILLSISYCSIEANTQAAQTTWRRRARPPLPAELLPDALGMSPCYDVAVECDPESFKNQRERQRVRIVRRWSDDEIGTLNDLSPCEVVEMAKSKVTMRRSLLLSLT